VAGNIVGAWVLTLPAAGILSGLVYGITTLFGSGVAGPIVITIVLVTALAAVFARRLQHAQPAPSTP
jgi:hypothetical protein